MKKLKNILLAFVLVFALCLPVFGLVGCDAKNESGLNSVATDVIKVGNGYLTSLVKQHTALVEKYELNREHEDPWEPAWEGDDAQVYENLTNRIQNYWDIDNPLVAMAEYAISANVMEPGKLYYSGRRLVNVEETNDGFILSSSGSNGDEKEYGYFRFVYDGNKLARAEASNIMYTYLEDWELWGACVFDKQVYDFKTNMAYTIQIEGKIPEKEVEEDPGEVGGEAYEMTSKEYWNGLEIFLNAYNSGKFPTELMLQIYNGKLFNDYQTYAQSLDKYELSDPDFYTNLRAMKKAGVVLDYTKVEDIPEYSIFDGEDMPDMPENVYDAMDAAMEYYLLGDNGLFINEKETEIDYKSTVKALRQVVRIVRDYEEWLNNMPTAPESFHEETVCEWDETYPHFPYKVALEMDNIDYFDTMLDYIEHTDKDHWGSKLLYDVELILESVEHGEDSTDYHYFDAHPEMTTKDAEGNITYFFADVDTYGYGEYFSFTVNTKGKVIGVELYSETPQE